MKKYVPSLKVTQTPPQNSYYMLKSKMCEREFYDIAIMIYPSIFYWP